MDNEVHCPKCNSTQIIANKKGFSGKKAVAGAVLTGGIGLLAGTVGSNKIVITCLNCGNQFGPGHKIEQPKIVHARKPPTKGTWIAQKVFFIIMLVFCSMTIIISAILNGWTVFIISIFIEGILFIGIRNANKRIKEFDK